MQIIDYINVKRHHTDIKITCVSPDSSLSSCPLSTRRSLSMVETEPDNVVFRLISMRSSPKALRFVQINFE